MKKKKFVSMLLVVIVLCLAVSGLVGCASLSSPGGDNLAAGATYTVKDKATGNDKTLSKFSLSDKRGGIIKITFPKETTFNTVVIKESTDTVTSFELWNVDGEKPQLIYKQDEIGKIRYCYLNSVTVRNLELRAYSTDGKFKLTAFEAYNVERKNETFRTSTYLTVDNLLAENCATEGIKHVTDLILFGLATYNETGALSYDAAKATQCIDKLKTICGDKMPRLSVNFVLSSTIKDDFPVVQKVALKTNKDTLINNLKTFLTEYNFDAISFDYEYPYSQDDYNVFSTFLVDLKAAIGDKLIAIAVAPWGLKFSKAAINAVDTFELMTYDLMDDRGNHNGWRIGCVDSIKNAVNLGLPKEKINLGVAFYSRPIDYGNYWGGYNEDADKLSEFSNYVADEFITFNEWSNETFLVKGRWYNGVNIIKDKTAYAYDNGIGGMMMWHYGCDTPYEQNNSLLRAMNSVLGR